MPNKQKKITYGLIATIIVFGAASILFLVASIMNHQDNPDDNIAINIEFDDDILNIDWSKYETYNMQLTDSIEITKPGVYVLSGKIADGSISINTSGHVKLELDNVEVANSSGPAIYVEQAKNVVISTQSGSSNMLVDGATYNGYEADEIGAIFSHDDLLLEGEGELIIESKNEDAIVSKDDLVFNGGTYQITAVDDGIRGKDSVYIQSGKFSITAGGDGIKATNSTESERGFVYIADGEFDITADLDGIQAETTLQINGGVLKMKTGGGSALASTDTDWGNWGRMPMAEAGNSPASDEPSAKCIKATDVFIKNGELNLDCSDDALHANGDLEIAGGAITIASGDDGIHADNDLIINNGDIKITKSYEGIEGAAITINGGTISVTASDDGLNASGGSDASSANRPGANNFKTDANVYIRITDGDIDITSIGDSIDSNSNIYIEGGNIIINGPTNGIDNAFDHDGELIISGGTVASSEMTGMMAGNISDSSKNFSAIINFSSTYPDNTRIALVDEDNVEVLSFVSKQNFNSITFSSPALKKGSTYTIKVNDVTYQSFTIDGTVTEIGTNSNGGIMRPGMSGGKASGTKPR